MRQDPNLSIDHPNISKAVIAVLKLCEVCRILPLLPMPYAQGALCPLLAPHVTLERLYLCQIVLRYQQ